MRTQNRGEEIDALLQSVEALSRRINAKLQERNERECCLQNTVRDTSEQTTRLEKINATMAQIRDLRGKVDEICASKVSVEQLVIEAEHRLQEEEKNAVNLAREIEGLCRSRCNISQEQKSANNERIRIDNLIRNCKSELKKLNNQICTEEDKVTHQERTIYDQDLKILQIESRLSELQGEVSLEEIEEYQEGIQHLSVELERLSRVQRKLATELEVLQVGSKQMERTFKKLLIEKAEADSRRASDTAYVEQTENSIKRCKNEYNKILVEKNLLQLQMRRTDESLGFYNEKVFTLEKDRLLMENCIKEREIDISIAMEMTATTLRLTTEENARLKKEINCRRLRTNKLMNR
ncbi:Coiled-coil domain-containing protein 39 [Taenia solium]|eukprot:TsM_000770400 transcript=TsM_000770400 gene=TsM_000770400